MDDTPTIEAGSYRDRHGRIFYIGDAVYRGISANALANWQSLVATEFFKRGMAKGEIVATRQVDPARDVGPPVPDKDWAAILEHERIPFISYPYEWCFEMLKDAALLQLELMRRALDEDMILKDASAYNVQWRGHKPVFIDVPSFENYRAGEPWAGYRQFCQLFLYPLMLQAYKNVAFHPWLRGNIDGLDADNMSRLMTGGSRWRRGVLTNVVLQAKLQRQHGDSKKDVKHDIKRAGFNKQLITANVNRLAKLVTRLDWSPQESQWSSYVDLGHYSDPDAQSKRDFVNKVIARRRRTLIWDLGCNVGEFSLLAAEHADQVVAMDADHLAVQRLYVRLKTRLEAPSQSNVLPLVINITDPPPAMGWRGQERKSLDQRGVPDLILCLALIHHVVIGANVPMPEFIDWLAGFKSAVVMEFVAKEDPMVMQLLRNKDDIYSDYGPEQFQECVNRWFKINDRVPLGCGTRSLFYLTPK